MEGEELGSKSFLSVVIPRLENLLQGRKRRMRRSVDGRLSEEDSTAAEEGEGVSPVKRLDRGKKQTAMGMFDVFFCTKISKSLDTEHRVFTGTLISLCSLGR